MKSVLEFKINDDDFRIIRMEYTEVRPIDITISENIKGNEKEDNINSMIGSFEKNPDMNGAPIKANLEIPKEFKIIGLDGIKELIWRVS